MKKRIKITIWTIVAILFLAPIILPRFEPWTWTELNCVHAEINIKTGKARYSSYLWYMKISERIEETPLSLTLQGETIDIKEIQSWRLFHSSSPGINHSPHYLFGAALSQAKELDIIVENLSLSPERKKEIARKILTLWQESEDYGSASDYLTSISVSGEPDSENQSEFYIFK